MKAEAKMLSECGTKYVLRDLPGDRYEVEIEPGDYLVVEFGAVMGRPGAKFQHPNVAASGKTVYEFKHYRHGGSKFWTAKAGVSHYFVIPRSAVKMIPEEGLSYVKAEINGVKVSFNVSGGGGSGLWTDWLKTATQVSVNHPVRDLKKVAEVAVRGTSMEPLVVKQMDVGEVERWAQLAANVDRDAKGRIYEMVEKGQRPVVKLMSGCMYDGKSEGQGVELQRGSKWHDLGEGRGELKYDGKVKSIVLEVKGWRVRAKVTQIDWDATAKANGVAA